MTADAWIDLPAADEVTLPDGHPYASATTPAMTRLLAAHPRLAKPLGVLFQEIMLSEDSELSRAEREMVAAVASAAQDCFY